MSVDYNNKKFVFMDCRVDPQANLIIKNAKEKRIEAKVMSLLVLFARNAGEVITKKQILSEIWPDVIVGEEVIAQLIYSLRNALGDDAKRPKYIETIPKKGYRFIAAVSLSQTKSVAVTADNTQPINKITKPILVVIGLLITSFLLLGWLYPTKEPDVFTINNILPVTQMLGREEDFALHKKHNNIAYVYHDGKQVDLYLKNLENNQQQRLTNDKFREYSPVWLDADTLIYIREKNKTYQIIRQHQQQSDNILYESTSYLTHLAVNNTTNTDITFIESVHYKNGRLTEIKSLNLINGNVKIFHQHYPQLPEAIHLPVYSSDGNDLYFLNRDAKSKAIYALNLQSKEVTKITDKFDTIYHLALAKTGQLLVAGSRSTTSGIWQLDIANNSIKLLLPTASGQLITKAILASQQNEIYYATIQSNSKQVLANITEQAFEKLPNLNSDAQDYSGVFSMDGKRIYFVSNRTGYFELWSYHIASEQLQQLTHLNATKINRPVLSASEKFLAVVYKSDDLTLGVISLPTGEVVSKIAIPHTKYPLSWSKDEQTIYVSEHRGQVNIYQYDRETLTSTLVQEKAGLFALENKEKQSLTLMDYNYQGIIKRNLVNGKITPLTKNISNISRLIPGQLKMVNNSILALKREGSNRQLYQYPQAITTNKNQEKLLMELPKGAFLTDINNSGDRAIFTQVDNSQGNIMKIKINR